MRHLPRLIFALSCACLAVTTAVVPAHAQQQRARKAPAPAAAAPIHVRMRDPLNDPTDAAHGIARRLRLEAGAMVAPTAFLDAGRARRDRDLYLLLATQRVEGGFDAVNVYDKGILSWGLMQWASHSNSLQDALWYVKRRLTEKNKGDQWTALFKAHSLDVQRGPGGAAAFHVAARDAATGKVVWRPLTGIDELRVLFRGTRKVGEHDPATVTRWVKVFARAGRNPTVQALQTEWAVERLHDCLGERVDADWTVRDFTAGDPFSDALMFALWTNNPNASREHFRRAVRQARLFTGEADPRKWPPALFPFVWEQVGRNSSFGTWGQRTRAVAEVVGVGSKGRRMAQVALASRGWRTEGLGRGGAVQRGSGRYWRREVRRPAPRLLPPPSRSLIGFFAARSTSADWLVRRALR